MLSCRSLHHLTSAGALCPTQICAPGVPTLPPTPGPPPRIPALLQAWPSPQLHPSRPNSGVTLHPRSMLGEGPGVTTAGWRGPGAHRGRQGPVFPGMRLVRTGRGGEGPGETSSLSGHHSGQPVHGSPRRLSLCRAAGLAPSCPVLCGLPPSPLSLTLIAWAWACNCPSPGISQPGLGSAFQETWSSVWSRLPNPAVPCGHLLPLPFSVQPGQL